MKNKFKLSRIILLGFCLTAFSCQEENSIPKPFIDNDKSDFTIHTEETLTIKPEIKTDGKTNYQWLENNIELSTEPFLEYSSKEIGEHKISFTAVNKGGSNKANFTITVIKNEPPVEAPEINFNEPEGGFTTYLGKEIKINPEVKTSKEATYLWKEDGKVLSKEQNFKYRFSKNGEHTISLFATNEGGTSTQDIKIMVISSYYYGMFMLNEGNMSNETGIISYIGNDGVKIDSVFQKANEGKTLGNVTQDMWIGKENIYFVSQNGPENIIVADRYSLKQKSSITGGFADNTWPTHIAVSNNKKAYVRGNDGLSIIDLNSMTVSGKVENVRASKQKMEFVNGKVIVPCGNELVIIDPNTDKVEKRIAINNISDIAEGINHCIWVGAGSELVKIETNNFTIESRYTMPEGFSIKGSWGSAGLCTNYYNNSVYWKEGTKICKFDAANETASTLVNVKDKFENANMIYGGLGLNPKTAEVYFGFIKGYGMDYLINGIGSVDGTTGATVKHYKNCVRFSVGAFFTDNFDY
jgi:PKD repeat protein